VGQATVFQIYTHIQNATELDYVMKCRLYIYCITLSTLLIPFTETQSNCFSRICRYVYDLPQYRISHVKAQWLNKLPTAWSPRRSTFHRNYLLKSLKSFKALHTKLNGASITSISQISTASVLVILIMGNKMYKDRMAPSGMMFIPSFMTIHQMVQGLLVRGRQEQGHDDACPSLG
jgi:hypothetical protein